MAEEHTTSAAWQINLGNGKRIETDFQTDGKVWSAAGTGVIQADLWMKEAVAGKDLRIVVRRVEKGISVSIDRGEEGRGWWQGSAAPSILVTSDNRGVVLIAASIGRLAGEIREINLGSVPVSELSE